MISNIFRESFYITAKEVYGVPIAILDDSIRLIALQFSFANRAIIPQSFRQAARPDMRSPLTESGVCVMDPVEHVFLADLLRDLGGEFELVDAFHQERVASSKRYQMVRFVFARSKYVHNLFAGFVARRPEIMDDLIKMSSEAMWRVRAFLNPNFQEGRIIPNQHALSINMEVREPLFEADGRPAMRWRRDERGERIGDAPMPFLPDHCLRIIHGALQLVAV